MCVVWLCRVGVVFTREDVRMAKRTLEQSYVNRRGFLGLVPAAMLLPSASIQAQETAGGSFPHQEATLVSEMVGASHGNIARVKELVSLRPALARAAWDWGYGDWETALGAASHVGNKPIAQVLLDHGAHPTIFSAAMLGQVEVVKMFVAASSGVQKIRGPHGITLLAHARAGGNPEMVKYIESLGDADTRYPSEPVDGGLAPLLGTYAFGAGPTERLIVSINTRGDLVIKRDGEVDRNLFHHGGRVFNPSGAEAVRIRFEPSSGTAASVSVIDGAVLVTARRSVTP